MISALQGQRILIVGRDYFFYTRTIVEELKQGHGAEVTYIPIVPETFVHSALKRVRRKIRDAGVALTIDAVRGVGFRAQAGE